MRVLIDRNEWSEESKRSYAFEYENGYYENMNYQCIKCTRSCVFTAEEQKETYEVKKSYIWQRRTLCKRCFKELQTLKKLNQEFEARWSKEEKLSRSDATYLKNWLNVINELPKYGKPKNFSKAEQLFKIINKDA